MENPKKDEAFEYYLQEMMMLSASDFMPMASAVHGLFTALMKVGFTEAQAFDLIKVQLANLVIGGFAQNRGKR